MALNSSTVDDLCLEMTPPPDDSTKKAIPPTPHPDGGQEEALGHQGVQGTGGIDFNLRVLYCTNMDLSLDYEGVHLIMKAFGNVERIKLRLTEISSSYDCYVTFQSNKSADKACKSLQGHTINNHIIKTSLFSVLNLLNDPHDFVPMKDPILKVIKRKSPSLVWHVAAYKEGKENLIRASDCIQNKVGQIPRGNMKKYGRNILIKAGNTTQAVLLTNFKPSDNGNIYSITPHKTFNTSRGVVYSQDLYDFSEEEILNLCPSDVCHVRKMGGSNNTIVLTFYSSFLPEHIDIGHLRIKVRKFRQNPTQCHNCFDYGHVIARCQNKKRCFVCSAEHETWNGCSYPRFCFHCSGSHSPNSRECPRRKLEQSIVEVASNEKISIGSAKRQVMGANRDPNSSYASAIKKMKGSNTVRKPPQEKRESQQNPSKSDTTPKRVPKSAKTAKSNSPAEKMSSCESLPDLSVKNPMPSSDPVPLVSESGDDGAKSISVETKSSIITVTKKQANEDGFSVLAARKRARPASPKSGNSGIELSNSFSTLEQSPSEKKQAVSTEDSEAGKSKPSTSQPRVESCRPKTHTMKEMESKADPPVQVALKPDKETKIPVHSSHHSKRGETKKARLKDNFIQAPKERAPQSRHDKTGKKHS